MATTVGRARSVATVGLDPVPVTVEAHVGPGLPAFALIGSSGAAAREAAHRVRTALSAAGISLPQCKVLVSLAPADVPKAGSRFDLAIAAAVLGALGLVDQQELDGCALLGELALDGGIRPVPGVLPAVRCLPAAGTKRLLVADGNAAEAALVGDLEAVPAAGLDEVVALLTGAQRPRPTPEARAGSPRRHDTDLADVRGQVEARRALEIAAAGGHHLLLLGPPGCGKSMLAKRLPTILPLLTEDQALELAAVRSLAGRLPHDGVLDRRPPVRAPHHGASAAALLGGGTGVARPGEVSLAHRGVLFLDELFEWSRHVIEALREPLEEGVVRIVRSKAAVAYPARFQLVCAANPCPCGGGDGCVCSDDAIWSYRARLSGPLADRLDLAPAVERLRADDLLAAEPGEPSAAVAARVARARAAAAERWGKPGAVNAEASPAALRHVTRPAALRRLAAAVESGELTGRGYDRTLRVARTIADLAGGEVVESEHVLEAHTHRLLLRAAARHGVGRR